jgi:hypothetical protein
LVLHIEQSLRIAPRVYDESLQGLHCPDASPKITLENVPCWLARTRTNLDSALCRSLKKSLHFSTLAVLHRIADVIFFGRREHPKELDVNRVLAVPVVCYPSRLHGLTDLSEHQSQRIERVERLQARRKLPGECCQPRLPGEALHTRVDHGRHGLQFSLALLIWC